MKARLAIGWVQPRVGSSEPQPRATEENEIRGKGVRYIGGRTIYRCQTRGPMTLPDFDRPRDPDASSKKLWAAVPEPVGKDVEQHVRDCSWRPGESPREFPLDTCAKK